MSGVPIVSAADGPGFVAALRTAGCAWVTDHGVPPALQDLIRERSFAFFDLPREAKAEFEWDGEGLWHGWQPVHEGAAAYGGDQRPTELLERFEVNTTAGVAAAETRWPLLLEDPWLDYLGHLHRVSSDLVRLVAGQLDRPAADLDAWTRGQFSNLVANFYPPQPEAPVEGRSRVDPHVDHGGLTILLVDDAPGGLEAWTGDEWSPVVSVPGALLVQGGELMTAWTGGQLPPNRHRVVNPPRSHALTRRLSIIWFHHPDLTWTMADGQPAGEVVQSRQEAYRGVA